MKIDTVGAKVEQNRSPLSLFRGGWGASKLFVRARRIRDLQVKYDKADAAAAPERESISAEAILPAGQGVLALVDLKATLWVIATGRRRRWESRARDGPSHLENSSVLVQNPLVFLLKFHQIDCQVSRFQAVNCSSNHSVLAHIEFAWRRRDRHISTQTSVKIYQIQVKVDRT